MSDLFSAYADERLPNRALDRNFPEPPLRSQFGKKHAADRSALEKKLDEKQRLSRGYKAWKRQERRRLIEAEPRLLDFMRFVRKMEPEQGDELIDAISVCDWLIDADQATRILALTMIQKRADRINLLLGLPVFSDPMPPETNVYLECRKLLTSRRRL